jgi:uncharacterized protein
MRIISQKMRPLHTSWLRKLEDHLIREKLRPGIHLLENPDQGIIFLKDSISVFSCPKPLMRALDHFLHGVPRAQAARSQNIGGPDFDALLQALFKKSESKGKDDSRAPKNKPQGTILDRLVLNVSNACNLRCRYCYAGGGNYGRPQSLMKEKTAARILDQFIRLFDEIHKIQFFGGEPLLNPDLIRFICEDIQRRLERGEIRERPRFSIVTNGTILSDEIIKLFEQYEIASTISLDGPELVNDYLRGEGTFRKICRFVRALQEHKIEYSFEGTYTAFHMENGLPLKDLLDFYHKHFQKMEIHMPPASLPKGHPLALDDTVLNEVYRDAVEYSLDNISSGHSPCSLSFASRMMNTFLEGKPIENYCPAGFSTLSADAQGNVYPCFMFTGNEDFIVGNVFAENEVRGRRDKPMVQKIFYSDKTRNPQCRECWASPFCSGCIGADYFKTGGRLEKTSCDLTKAMAEGFLAKVVNLMDKNPNEFSQITTEEGGERRPNHTSEVF